jgi:hypothetical protein
LDSSGLRRVRILVLLATPNEDAFPGEITIDTLAE